MEIIAEVGLNHYGSLDLACKYIKAISDFGADTAKFQMHVPAKEHNAPLRVGMAGIRDRVDLWEKTAFTPDEWKYLIEVCQRYEVDFLASVFCPEAIDILFELGVRRFKVPSGQLTNESLLGALAASSEEVLLSTGLHPLDEVEDAVMALLEPPTTLSREAITVLECCTAYPTRPDQIDLYHAFADGLSDHSGTIYPGLVACWRELRTLEVHVIFDKQMGGPDAEASLDFIQLGELVDGCRFLGTMMQSPTHDEIVDREGVRGLRKLFVPSELE